jgi:uncharacterized LabA/DUF88 family protein
MSLTAILIDGEFCLHRMQACYKDLDFDNPVEVADEIHKMAWRHLYPNKKDSQPQTHDLYRIFFYDCMPLSKKHACYPISKERIDFSRTKTSQFRTQLHKELVKKRKVALRLGEISSSSSWQLYDNSLKQLIKGQKQWTDLEDKDFRYNITQKGVDMRIGLDIASLALKKQVNQIVLISGDSDFVPAAKLARREGIDFILDPMWSQKIPDHLSEHIDGIQSVCPKPSSNKDTSYLERIFEDNSFMPDCPKPSSYKDTTHDTP